jgi:hypothetical protein
MSHLELISQEKNWLIFLIAGSGFLALLTAIEPLLGIGASILMLAMLLAAYLGCRPWHLFALYLFLLAPHVPLMAILYVQLGLPATVVKAISAWKELTLLLFLAVALVALFRSRWQATIPDLIIALYLLLVGLYLIYSLPKGHSLTVLFYGLRDLTLPILLYIVGRSVPFSEKWAQRILNWLLWATLIYSFIGIIEWLFIPTEWHVELGLPRYYQELLGQTYAPYYLGLPENFWRTSGAGRLRRAVSIYGSSQSFALSFLLLFPAATYGLLTRTLRESRLATLTFIVGLIGLLITITRFTIVVCVGLFILASLISSRRARRWATVSSLSLLITFLLGVFLSDTMRKLVTETLYFQDYSSSSRLDVWWRTVLVVLEQPLGYGITSVGFTATRLTSGLIGIEGQYSKIAIELGIPGLLIYLSVLLSISAYLFVSYYQLKEPYTRGLCLISALALLGMFANALTTEWHNSISLVYPAWWLAGSCVSVASQTKKDKLNFT